MKKTDLSKQYSNLEIIKLIREIENKFPVENWKIGTIHFWPIIRNNLPFLLIKSYSKTDSQYQNNTFTFIRSFFRKFYGIYQAIDQGIRACLTIAGLWFYRKHSEAILLSDGLAKTKINNIWIDRFCDPLLFAFEAKGQKALLLEQVNSDKLPSLNIYTSLQPIERISYYLARIFTLFYRSVNENDSYEEFLEYISRYNISQNLVEEELSISSMQIRIISRLFDWIIKWYNVKQLYVVCYYGTLGYALALSARRNNIKLTDIEHGSIMNCPAYCSWGRLPRNGYAVLPTHFSLWHDILADVMTKSNSDSFNRTYGIEVGGISFINFLKKFNLDNELCALKKIKRSFKKIIVITLQPQFYGANNWDTLAEKILEDNSGFAWWIRSHPTYKNQKGMKNILSISKENVFYDDGSMPLYLLFEFADYLITTASASSLEAMIFNIPVIFISETGMEDFEVLVNSNFATYVSNMDLVIGRIKE